MTYVYFAQAAQDGPIKIGFTGRDPRRRRTKLQTDCPWPVVLLGAVPGDRSDENRLQAQVYQHRIHGDWFHPGADVLALVREQLAQPTAWRAPTKICAGPTGRVIDKCGGYKKVSEWLGIDISNVYRFTYPRARGGTEGLIPAHHQGTLLEKARENGVDLRPDDFFAEPQKVA